MPRKPCRRRIVRYYSQAKTLVVFIPILVLPYARAGNQIASGTIIVIAQTKQWAIIAADSRAGTTPNGITVTSTNDCDCKVTALRSHLVFSSAGVLGTGNANWTAVSEAVTAAGDIPTSGIINPAEGTRLLESWAHSMIHRLSDFSTSQLLSVALANDGHITTGILAGVDATGNVWLQSATISYSTFAGLSSQPYILGPTGIQSAYYFLGKSEVAMEFAEDQTSRRAVAERASWSHKNRSRVAFDRFKARRLVELTILYHSPRSDVGGPIDELQLDAKGVHWIQKKPNCKEQE